MNLPSQGYMHGDAAYNAALKQWCIVVMSGGRIQETDQWRCVAIDGGPRQSRICFRANHCGFYRDRLRTAFANFDSVVSFFGFKSGNRF